MFGIDHSALPAIGQQFRHLSLAVTEQHYLGNDPQLLAVAQEAVLTKTVSTLFELAHGERLAVGGLAKLLAEHAETIQALVRDKSRAEGMAAVKSFVLNHDLRLYFQDHGKCGIQFRPLEAKCHQVSGVVEPISTRPNWETRRPSLCASCSCWMVDAEHAQFWSARYRATRRAELLYADHKSLGMERLFRQRAQQAAGVLRGLQLVVPSDEEVLYDI